MTDDNLCLDVGSEINIEGVTFTVEGYIAFEESCGTSWVEYKIKSKDTSQIKWLSIDRIYDEYVVYTQQCYSSDFLEENIMENGYEEVDSNLAKVVDYRGDVDVSLGEEVFYKEYEDDTEELVLSIEEWSGEFEYSKGYYIDEEDIQGLNFEFNDKLDKSQWDSEGNNKNTTATIGTIIGVVISIIVIACTFKNCLSNKAPNNALSKFVSSNGDFQYITSVTSDLDNSKKADVYSINRTVEETAKLIIDGVNGNIEDVQENTDDGTVVMASSDELGLIYVSEDAQTLIQVSTREYVYSSRNTPYRGSNMINGYYRAYYYRSFYNEDRNKYSNSINGYSDYDEGTFTPNNNNKYKNYSNSIRQGSTTSRPSSGGGTSAGK